jgi:DNA-binding NtrC family response regulator
MPPNTQQLSQTPRRLALLVDDDEAFRVLFARLLQQQGLEVVPVPNALVALTFLEGCADETSVIVADERMPGLAGSRMLAAVGTRWPAIRRVLVTAHRTGRMIFDADYPVFSKSADLQHLARFVAQLARS